MGDVTSMQRMLLDLQGLMTCPVVQSRLVGVVVGLRVVVGEEHRKVEGGDVPS